MKCLNGVKFSRLTNIILMNKGNPKEGEEDTVVLKNNPCNSAAICLVTAGRGAKPFVSSNL